MRITRFLSIAAIPLLAAAQSNGPRIFGPVLGYAFDDGSKSLRAITGVPGAAALDGAIAFPISLDSAFAHSRARVAVANTKDGGVALLRWSDAPQVLPLSTSLARVTVAAFDAAGARVTISDGAAVEVWSGLQGDVQLQASFAADSLGGAVTALALDSAGKAIAATANGVLQLGDSPVVLAGGGDWVSVALSGTALVAAAPGRLILIPDLANAAAVSLTDRIASPSALAFARDGSRLAVGNLADKTVQIIDAISGSTIASLACGCSAQRFEMLDGNLVFRIVDPSTALMVDADNQQPRTASLPELSSAAVRNN